MTAKHPASSNDDPILSALGVFVTIGHRLEIESNSDDLQLPTIRYSLSINLIYLTGRFATLSVR